MEIKTEQNKALLGPGCLSHLGFLVLLPKATSMATSLTTHGPHPNHSQEC